MSEFKKPLVAFKEMEYVEADCSDGHSHGDSGFCEDDAAAFVNAYPDEIFKALQQAHDRESVDVEGLMVSVREYIQVRADFNDQPNESAKDAYLYHLCRLITSKAKMLLSQDIEDIKNAAFQSAYEQLFNDLKANGYLSQGFKPTHKHNKRGTSYQLVAFAMAQTDTPLEDYASVVVYRDESGAHWVRPNDEFHDGRFDELPQPPESEGV